jgi:hypothetical protein
MLQKISALNSVRELSKKEQNAIHGGANYQCTSTIMPGVYDSDDDISGDYGNGHVITCYATRQAVGNPVAAS